ncbi:MAG: hypothetical protein ACRC1P_07650 [Cellulosilyticaceae bacterium]
MKRIGGFMKKHPICFGGLSFGALSLLCNFIWIGLTGMAHINDIIHVLPVIFVYSPIIKMLGGGMLDPEAYLPLAIVIDAIVGMLWVRGSYKFIKADRILGGVIIGGFSVYWIVITFQWLLIL